MKMGQGKVVRELEGLKRALLESRQPVAERARAPRPTLRSLHPFRTKAGDDGGLPLKVKPEKESVDVIDLGAPGFLHVVNSQNKRVRRYRYTPNPRLYPGPSPNVRNITNNNGNNSSGSQRGRRRKRVYRRPVPNSRLYRPAPPRQLPPPASPSGPWPPPPAPTNALETASHAALRLSERRVLWRPPSPKHGKPRTRSLKPVPRFTLAKDHSRSPKRRNLRSKVVSTSAAPTSNKAPAKSLWSKASSRVRSPKSQRLVVTLPAAGDARHTPLETVTYRYRPASEHFRARVLETDSGTSSPHACVPSTWTGRAMDAPRYSTSPEDCSEGNDSAPSEFLAEFLSAIMQRQYAEALKYCRLILQYEPNNATARGFYPLLQQKLAHAAQAAQVAHPAQVAHAALAAHVAHAAQHSPPPARPAHARPLRAARPPRSSRVRHTDSLLDVSSGSSGEENADLSPSTPHEVMEQEADSAASCSGSWSPCEAGAAAPAGPRRSGSSGSVASQSSLELDSSEALVVRSSPEPSFELSRRTDRTDSASGSGAGWESSGSAPPSSACDDNGNPAPPAPPRARSDPDACACDAENNERSQPPSPRASFAARALVLKSEDSSASLRRLRAQYTCSIK